MALERTNKVDDWLDEDSLVLLTAWARDGDTYKTIAEKIGIAQSTLSLWREKYKEIEDALNSGREVVDYKVENALLKAALGYEVKETRVLARRTKNGNIIIEDETTIKHVGPNTTAIAIWLNNRKPDQWKRNRDNIASLTDDDNNITVNIIKGNALKPTKENSKNKEGNKNNKEHTNKNERLETIKSELSEEEREWLEGED